MSDYESAAEMIRRAIEFNSRRSFDAPIDEPVVDETYPGPVKPVSQEEACKQLGGYHDPLTGQCRFRDNVPPGKPRPPPRSYMEEENPPLPDDTAELSLSDAMMNSPQEYGARRKAAALARAQEAMMQKIIAAKAEMMGLQLSND